MSSRSDGIFVPYRVLFITVIVSVCINIFFLLMGILIGKDDLAWEEQQASTPATQVETRLREGDNARSEENARERVERELANFDQEDERQEPVDISGVRDKSKERVVEDKPVVRNKPPETVRNDPPPKKDPPPSTAQKTQTTPSGDQFWIQLSATSDQKKAIEFRDKVKRSGYSAVMFQEGGMYKIQVGPFNSRNAAEADRKKINAEFKINAWIRTR